MKNRWAKTTGYRLRNKEPQHEENTAHNVQFINTGIDCVKS